MSENLLYYTIITKSPPVNPPVVLPLKYLSAPPLLNLFLLLQRIYYTSGFHTDISLQCLLFFFFRRYSYQLTVPLLCFLALKLFGSINNTIFSPSISNNKKRDFLQLLNNMPREKGKSKFKVSFSSSENKGHKSLVPVDSNILMSIWRMVQDLLLNSI